MTLTSRPVIVKELPPGCDRTNRRVFLQALNAEMARLVRPSVVLDCSRAQHIDREVLHLLLCCLEEAMKRNGDVRLAGFNPEARALVESAGVARLFKIFASSAEAVNSFRKPALEEISPTYVAGAAEAAASAA